MKSLKLIVDATSLSNMPNWLWSAIKGPLPMVALGRQIWKNDPQKWVCPVRVSVIS